MSGIAGMLDLRGSPVDARVLPAMIRALAHRGPEGESTWNGGSVALAHARLSTIDSVTGAQPLASPSGALRIVLDGEIENHRELRRELESRSHRFATASDAEVILHLYEERGEACIESLNGQFAFALWDSRKRVLILARDRMGAQPLYYAVAGHTLCFASEVKGLFANREVTRAFDPLGLDHVFTFGSALAPRTVFREVSQLSGGTLLRVTEGNLRSLRYASTSFRADPALENAAACAEQLQSLLVESIRLRLRGETPSAVALSGGLASSLILSLVRSHSESPLRSFSIALDDPKLDERRFQEQVVDELGSAHSTVTFRRADVTGLLPEVIRHCESPLAHTLPVQRFALGKRARDSGFRVLLTGEGANELFGGSSVYTEAKIRSYCAAHPDSELRAILLETLPASVRGESLAASKDELEHPFASHLPRWRASHQVSRLYAKDFLSATESADPTSELRASLPEDFAAWQSLGRAQWLETALALPGQALSLRVDRALAAHGVQARLPFLDPRVADLAGRLPARMKLRALHEKPLLKRVARGLVPSQVLARPRQPESLGDGALLLGADGAPRAEWVERALSSESLRGRGVFDPRAVESLAERISNGSSDPRDHESLTSVLTTQLVAETLL